MPHNLVRLMLVLLLLGSQAVLHADTSNDWLRGTGNHLEMRLQGEVLNVEGHPAIGADVDVRIFARAGEQAVEAKLDGHRFEVWVRVSQTSLYSISFKASLNGDEQVAYKSLSAFELRQAAIDGFQMSLQLPTRPVEVKVTESGKPVAGAKLIAGLNKGTEVGSVADDQGIVRLKLLPDQTLSRLTAWTDDFRVGGYGFDRTPVRDPKQDEHVVELSSCRNLKMRFVDQSGVAVPGVDFTIHVATPEPNFNYVGQTENTRMKTDSNGEALYRWFPDWAAHHFYVESNSESWYVDQEWEVFDGLVVFKLTRSKIADRKSVEGIVRSPAAEAGGYFVSAHSFQADRENHSDHLSSFTNPDGTFSVDVLPDATYCFVGIDTKWVSSIIDLIPYQSKINKISKPELTLSAGQQVEVVVTTGSDRRPYPNLSVSFESEYSYAALKDGKKQYGNGGPRWFATTDAAGRIQTPANLGKLNVSVYTPLWQTKESHDVSMGQPTKISLHRDIEAKRKIQGQLLLQDGLDARLDNAVIAIGALGGSSRDNQVLKSDSNGAFAFETLASPVGVFARTKDGRAAGLIVLTNQLKPGKFALRRTLDFVGQLLSHDGKPSVGARVVAKVRVDGKQEDRDNSYVGTGFEAMSLEVTTDHQGKYTIAGVPCEMKVSLSVVLSSTSEKSSNLGSVWLEENESRPMMVSHIGDTNLIETTLATRFEKKLRDSRLLGFPVMVILSDKSDAVADFVNVNFVNYDLKPEVASYLQFAIPRNKTSLKETDADFLKEHNWQLPIAGSIFACVLDANGDEVGKMEVDVSEKGADEKVAAFVSKYLPPKLDAEKKWMEAFAEAKRTNRKVLARLGGRYCGPCFLLARWLDDHRAIFDKDYVMLKIDEVADLNGVSVAKRITGGAHFGIPFCAIFDSDGALLVDGDSPLGNIGFPSGYEGSKYLRKMLMATRSLITDAEIEQLIASLAE